MTRINAEIQTAAKQSVGVFGSLNFWPLCPGCGVRHPDVSRSGIKVCEACTERDNRRTQWRAATTEVGSLQPAAPLLSRLCQQVGVNQGFWRNGKPPSFRDVGLKERWRDVPCRHGAYLWGPAGCHKTHMLCARTISAARRGYEARLVNWRAMCQDVTATWGKGDQTESSVIRRLVELDYLAVDDIGAGLAALSKVQQSVLANITYDVLNGRYNRGAHTDLSANWAVEYMAEFFDERILRRITELTTAYYMGQEDNDGRR